MLNRRGQSQLRPRRHVPGYFWIRNFFFPDTATVHTSVSGEFDSESGKNKSVLQSGKKYIRNESDNVWTGPKWKKNKSATNPITCGRVNLDIFLSDDVNACVQRGGRTEQISRHYLALRRMLWRHFSAEEPWVPEWIRIRVDGEIFVSGKKKLRIPKYPDSCGRGLKFIFIS